MLVGVAAAGGIFTVVQPAGAAAVTGSGTMQSPFIAGCDARSTSGAITPDAEHPEVSTTCTVTFPGRTVKPLDSEQLDFYQCPLDHAYLENKNYAPPAKWIDRGIEIRGMGPFSIDANVEALSIPAAGGGWNVYMGNAGGTVTNWNTDARDYGVTLHCTNDINQSYVH